MVCFLHQFPSSVNRFAKANHASPLRYRFVAEAYNQCFFKKVLFQKDEVSLNSKPKNFIFFIHARFLLFSEALAKENNTEDFGLPKSKVKSIQGGLVQKMRISMMCFLHLFHS